MSGPISLHILAGKYRRRRLRSNPGMQTRPLTNRGKEVLFENLGGDLHGERVADIFSGTGTIGLEALSRGASSAVFIEKDRKAFDLLQENVSHVGVEDDSFCWNADVFRCSFAPKNLDHLLPYDLIFFDPPYKIAKDIQPGKPLFKALEKLSREHLSSTEAMLVLRVPEHCDFVGPSIWEHAWELKLSSMVIHVYRKGILAEPAAEPDNEPSAESQSDPEC